MLHVQFFQPVLDVSDVGVLPVGAEQLGKQVEVGEHAGEQLTVGQPVLRTDDLAVDQNHPRRRSIQAAEQARQAGFAAAVAAHEEHGFATAQGQVDRADIKTRLVALGRVVVFDVAQFEGLPVAGDVARGNVEALVVLGQGQGLDFIQRHTPGDLRRDRRHRQNQRRAHEQHGQRVGGRHFRRCPAQTVRQIERQADGAEDHDVGPVAGQAVITVSQGEMLAVALGGDVEGFFVQTARAVAVEGQLFAPVNHALIALIELVFRLTQRADVGVEFAHQQPAHAEGERHPAQRGDEQRRRQPGQVTERRDAEHRAVDQVRQLHESHGHGANVAGQAGEDLRPADGFDALDVGVQQAFDHHPAQAVDKPVTERCQRQRRARRQRQQHGEHQAELPQRRAEAFVAADHALVDEGNHADAQQPAADAQQQHHRKRPAVLLEDQTN